MPPPSPPAPNLPPVQTSACANDSTFAPASASHDDALEQVCVTPPSSMGTADAPSAEPTSTAAAAESDREHFPPPEMARFALSSDDKRGLFDFWRVLPHFLRTATLLIHLVWERYETLAGEGGIAQHITTTTRSRCGKLRVDLEPSFEKGGFWDFWGVLEILRTMASNAVPILSRTLPQDEGLPIFQLSFLQGLIESLWVFRNKVSHDNAPIAPGFVRRAVSDLGLVIKILSTAAGDLLKDELRSMEQLVFDSAEGTNHAHSRYSKVTQEKEIVEICPTSALLFTIHGWLLLLEKALGRMWAEFAKEHVPPGSQKLKEICNGVLSNSNNLDRAALLRGDHDCKLICKIVHQAISDRGLNGKWIRKFGSDLSILQTGTGNSKRNLASFRTWCYHFDGSTLNQAIDYLATLKSPHVQQVIASIALHLGRDSEEYSEFLKTFRYCLDLMEEIQSGSLVPSRRVQVELLSRGNILLGCSTLTFSDNSKHFVGRVNLISTCLELLNAPNCNVLGIFGPSGVGKSFLIEAVIYQYESEAYAANINTTIFSLHASDRAALTTSLQRYSSFFCDENEIVANTESLLEKLCTFVESQWKAGVKVVLVIDDIAVSNESEAKGDVPSSFDVSSVKSILAIIAKSCIGMASFVLSSVREDAFALWQAVNFPSRSDVCSATAAANPSGIFYFSKLSKLTDEETFALILKNVEGMENAKIIAAEGREPATSLLAAAKASVLPKLNDRGLSGCPIAARILACLLKTEYDSSRINDTVDLIEFIDTHMASCGITTLAEKAPHVHYQDIVGVLLKLSLRQLRDLHSQPNRQKDKILANFVADVTFNECCWFLLLVSIWDQADALSNTDRRRNHFYRELGQHGLYTEGKINSIAMALTGVGILQQGSRVIHASIRWAALQMVELRDLPLNFVGEDEFIVQDHWGVLHRAMLASVNEGNLYFAEKLFSKMWDIFSKMIPPGSDNGHSTIHWLNREFASVRFVLEHTATEMQSANVYVPLQFAFHKPPLSEKEQRFELDELLQCYLPQTASLLENGESVDKIPRRTSNAERETRKRSDYREGAANAEANIRSVSPSFTSEAQTQASQKQYDPPRVLLVQGAAGTGKTMIGWRMLELCNDARRIHKGDSDKVPLPVVINLSTHRSTLLKALAQDYDGDFLVERLAEAYGLKDGDLVRTGVMIGGANARRSFCEGRFIFVLDGVDELNQFAVDPSKPDDTTAFPIGKLYNLDKWPNSAFVVSSRTYFFKDDHEMMQFCGPRGEDGVTLLKQAEGSKTVMQIHLLPFVKEQQDLYVKNFASVYADMYPGWDEGRFTAALEQSNELHELLTEPLMMYLVLHVLPMLKSDTGINNKLRLNPMSLDVEADPPYVFPTFKRAEIYALFIHSWMVRESKRNGKWNKEHNCPDDGFVKELTTFCQNTAFQMFTNVAQKDLQLLDATKDEFAEEVKKQQVQAANETIIDLLDGVTFRCSPLKKTGSVYSFLHKTIQEYFVASSLFRNLAELWDGGDGKELLKEGRFNSSLLFLNRRLVTSETGNAMNTLRFCADLLDRRVQHYVSFGTNQHLYISGLNFISIQPSARALWEIIQASRSPIARDTHQHLFIATAAANAMMILIAGGIQFSACDLSNATLGPTTEQTTVSDSTTFGDFSGGRFMECDFRGSNLVNARLDGCDFSGAKLDEGDWRGVKLGQLPMMLGHGGPITSVCVTPDGRHVVSGSTDRTIRVWLLESGEEVHTFKGHTLSVTSVCLTSNGKYVISGSSDKTVRVWSLEKMQSEQVRNLLGHKGEVASVCATPDGMQAVSGSGDKTICVWAIESGTKLYQLKGHTKAVTSVCMRPDGSFVVVSGSDDKTVRMWSLENGRQLSLFENCVSNVTSICVAPDCKHVVVGSKEENIQILSLDMWKIGKVLFNLVGHSERVNSVYVTPDGKSVVSGSKDETVRVWSMESGKQLHKLDGHTARVNGVSVTVSSEHVVSGSDDLTLRVWTLASGEHTRKIIGHSIKLTSVCLSPDNKHIITGSADNSVRVWSLMCGEQVRKLDGHTGPVSCVSMTPDSQFIVSGSDDNTVRVWSLASGKLLHRLENEYTWNVTSVHVSPDGQRVVSGYKDGKLRVWWLENGEMASQIDGRPTVIAVTSVCFMLEDFIVFGTQDKVVCIWSLKTNRDVHVLKGHSGAVTSVCVVESEDDLFVASGSADKTIRVWSLLKWDYVMLLKGHRDAITSMCGDSSGERLVSSSMDKTVVVWSIPSGEQVHVLEHESGVSCVFIALDGQFLISGSDDLIIRVWKITNRGIVRKQRMEQTKRGHFSLILGEHESFGLRDKTGCIWSLETGKQVQQHDGRTRAITSLCVTPDGKYVLSGSVDSTVRIWSLATGELAHQLVGHTKAVTSLCVTPDGRYVISVSCDESVRIWSLETNKMVRRLEGRIPLLTCAYVTLDSRNVVLVPRHGSIMQMWSLKTGKLVRQLHGHTGAVTSVCMTPDGKYVVSGSLDNSLRVWSLANGKQVYRLIGHIKVVICVCISPDGNYLVSGSGDKSVGIWSLQEGRLVHQLFGHNKSVTSVYVTPDSMCVLSKSPDELLIVWSLETGKCLRHLKGSITASTTALTMPDSKHVLLVSNRMQIWSLETGNQVSQLNIRTRNCIVTNVCLTPDGKHIVYGSPDGTARVFSLENDEQLHKFDGHTRAACSVYVSSDCKYVVIGLADKSVRVWLLESGKQLWQLAGHSRTVTSVCVTPDGMCVVSGSADNTVRVWSLENGKQLRQFDGHTDRVTSVSVAPDGKHVVSGSNDKTVCVWSLESGKLALQFKDHTDIVGSACVTPNGTHVVSGSKDESVQVWLLKSGEQVRRFDLHTGFVRSVCVAPNGKHVFSGSSDNTVRVWSMESGDQVHQLLGHNDSVTSVCVTPDGKHVVSGSYDKTVRVWSLESGEQVRQLNGHTRAVTSLCVTADGRYVVSVALDETVRIWPMEAGDFLRPEDSSKISHLVRGEDVELVALDSSDSIQVNRQHPRPVLVHCFGGGNSLRFNGCSSDGLNAPTQARDLIAQLALRKDQDVQDDEDEQVDEVPEENEEDEIS